MPIRRRNTPGKTVRDFKNFVLKETGVETGGEFCQISDAHLDFWRLLNNLWTNLENPRPEDVKDVDAEIELTEKEWEELKSYFERITISANNYCVPANCRKKSVIHSHHPEEQWSKRLEAYYSLSTFLNMLDDLKMPKCLWYCSVNEMRQCQNLPEIWQSFLKNIETMKILLN